MVSPLPSMWLHSNPSPQRSSSHSSEFAPGFSSGCESDDVFSLCRSDLIRQPSQLQCAAITQALSPLCSTADFSPVSQVFSFFHSVPFIPPSSSPSTVNLSSGVSGHFPPVSLITHHLVFMAQVFLAALVIPHRLLEDLILKIYASRME